jgi:hypothetical protein
MSVAGPLPFPFPTITGLDVGKEEESRTKDRKEHQQTRHSAGAGEH